MPGSVGPFWAIAEGGRTTILALAVPLDEAVSYGDMLTVEAGHYDLWTSLAERGSARLLAAGLPTAPAWSEYEEWPRGRVMYEATTRRFVIRADRQLHRRPFVALIAQRFGLDPSTAIVLGDDHYRSTRRVDI